MKQLIPALAASLVFLGGIPSVFAQEVQRTWIFPNKGFRWIEIPARANPFDGESRVIESKEQYDALLKRYPNVASDVAFRKPLENAKVDYAKETLVLIRSPGTSLPMGFVPAYIGDKVVCIAYNFDPKPRIILPIDQSRCIALAVDRSLVKKVEVWVDRIAPDKLLEVLLIGEQDQRPAAVLEKRVTELDSLLAQGTKELGSLRKEAKLKLPYAVERPEINVFGCGRTRADDVAQVFRDLFVEKDGPLLNIAVHSSTNSVWLRGSPEQLENARAVLARMEADLQR